MDEREAMVRALELAWRGWGRAQPNPLVGAVVLASDGRVLGEGWHAEFGIGTPSGWLWRRQASKHAVRPSW